MGIGTCLEEIANVLPGISENDLVKGLSTYSSRTSGISFSVVVKVSGQNLEENDTYDLEAVCGSLAIMQQVLGTVNAGMVVLHGAGTQLDKSIGATGLPNKKVKGLRYTDDATYGLIKKEMQSINAKVVHLLKSYGANPVSLPEGAVLAQSLGPEYGGRVGRPIGINHDPFSASIGLNGGKAMYVATSLGTDGNGFGYNVNADDAAATLVASMKPKLLLFVTSTGGVLADVQNEKSVVPCLTLEEAAKLSKDGMLVKVEAIKAALTESPSTRMVITAPNDMAYSLFKTAGTIVYDNKNKAK